MIGKIIAIEGNTIELQLEVDLKVQDNLINLHVIIESNGNKVVAEVLDIKNGIAILDLLGEIRNNIFLPGVIRKPSFSSAVRMVSKEELVLLIGNPDVTDRNYLYIGKSPLYKDFPVNVKLNDFFSNHFSILGNTGSGKSCAVARIIQNMFYKPDGAPLNASIFIFDAYGEYHTAFETMNDHLANVNFKTYTTDLNPFLNVNKNQLRIPLWLLRVDDLALLLEATESSQLSIIEKTLKLVNVFSQSEENVEVARMKNDIIARALLDILYSGKSPSQIRDQIIAVLSNFYTNNLNLESKIIQPGYVRTLKQCFNIDANGKINEIQLVTEFIKSFTNDGMELTTPDGTFTYTLRDLEKAMDFALISEGILKSEKVFDYTNILRVRLHSLITGSYGVFFEVNDYITQQDFITELVTTKEGQKAQLINFNIDYVDDRFAKVITKIFSRMIFEYAATVEPRASMPFHIVLEEAHRYVQNDLDTKLLGYNIFDRITKEGRKYGVILGLISQRPSELSDTAISQCSNFLIFRMVHPKDLAYITDMVPNMVAETARKLKILQPGTCVCFGNAFKVPVIVALDMPNPKPESSNTDIATRWFPVQ